MENEKVGVVKKFIEEFKAFALKGNVMDLAVGVIIGAAFSGHSDIVHRKLYQSYHQFYRRR